MRLDPEDLDTLWERSAAYEELKDPRRAIDGFVQTLQARPDDIELAKELARVRVFSFQKH